MSDIQTVPVDEDKTHLDAQIAEAKQYYLTPKYKAWEDYFYDKKNKETFGNATISYCMAYGLDPEDPKAYNVASVEGHKNLRKTKDIRRRYWEKRGMTAGKLMDLYNKMMIERKDVNLLYSVANDMGVELPEYKTIINAKNAFQQNNFNVNVEGGVDLGKLTDEQLKQFTESKRFALRSSSLIGSGETIQGEPIEVQSLPPETIRSNSE